MNTERFAPGYVLESETKVIRKTFQIPSDAVVVTMIARLVKEKGVYDFIQGASVLHATCPEAHFLLVGDGPEYGALEQRIREKGLVRVHLAGRRDDIPALLAASDMYVLPSYREGMPVTIDRKSVV